MIIVINRNKETSSKNSSIELMMDRRNKCKFSSTRVSSEGHFLCLFGLMKLDLS